MNFIFVDASRCLWGTEQALLELAKGCANAGHRVLAVVREDSGMAVAMRRVPGIELHETPFRAGEDPRALKLVLKLGREARADWLVAAHGKHHWPLWLASRVLGCKLAAFRHLSYIRSRVTRYWMPRLADRYFVVSEFARSRLIDDGVPPHCLHISHNPIDTVRFQPSLERRVALRLELGLSDDVRLAGFVGRHENGKGVRVLREVVIGLIQSRSDLHMLWVGCGPELAATREAVEGASQGLRHHFIEWHDYPERVYPALDLLLCPSEADETFGRVVAEAGACGVPVIASARGGLPEAMLDGTTGLLWRGGDACSLAGVAGGLLDDPARRLGMARAAPAWVSRFDTRRVSEEFVAQLD